MDFYYTVFLLDNGDCYACGTSIPNNIGIPTKLPITNVNKIRMDYIYGVYFILENGNVYQMTPLYGVSNPVLTDLTDISDISIGYSSHTLYLNKNGDVYSQGLNNSGQLGDGTTTDRSTPVKIFSNAIQIDSCFHTSAIIDASHNIYLFGDGSNRQLGVGYVPYGYSQLTPTIASISGSPITGVTNVMLMNQSTIIYCGDIVYGAGDFMPDNFTQLNLPPLVPAAYTCFTGEALVQTDQGWIRIDNLTTSHTLQGRRVQCVTINQSMDDHLICIEKSALGPGIPIHKTLVSLRHKIDYHGLKSAYELVGVVDAYKQKYRGQLLYNVVLEKWDTMNVNGMTVETLDPENEVAKYYMYPEISNRIVQEKVKELCSC
jgi:hypothetical protein